MLRDRFGLAIKYKMMHGMKKFLKIQPTLIAVCATDKRNQNVVLAIKIFKLKWFRNQMGKQIMKSQPNLDLRLCDRQAQPKFSGSGKIDDNFENE